MKYRKAQNLMEFAIVGFVILAVCLAGVFFFGDNIASVFNDNPLLSVFTKGRNAKQVDPHSLLSNVSIKVNGQTNGSTIQVNSPVESVIRQELQNGTYAQTSGSSGQITETLDVALGYALQMEKTLADLKNSGVDTSNISAQLTKYEAGLITEANANGHKAGDQTSSYIQQLQSTNPDLANSISSNYQQSSSDTLGKLVSYMDSAVKMDSNGSLATGLQAAIDSLNIPDSTEKSLLKESAQSLLSLGNSLGYSIDSRLTKTIANGQITSDSVISSISTSIDTVVSSGLLNSDDLATINNIKLKLNSGTIVQEDIKTYETQINEIISHLQGAQTALGTTSSNIKGGLTSNNAGGISFSSTSNTNYSINISQDGKLNLKINNSDAHYVGNWSDISNFISSQLKDVFGMNVASYSVFKDDQGRYYYINNTIKNSDGTMNSSGLDIKSVGIAYKKWGPFSLPTLDYNNFTSSVDNNKLDAINACIDQCHNIIKQLDSLPNTLTTQDIINNLNKVTDQTTRDQYAKLITIYRNGNYTDILPNTYNNAQLCKTLGGTVNSSNECTFN